MFCHKKQYRFKLFVLMVLFHFVSMAITVLDAEESFSIKETRHAEDVLFMTEGVEGILPSGQPGPIAIHQPNAFPVLTGEYNYSKGIRQPLVVASRLGKGRIVAFGHDGYISLDMFTKTDDMKRFFLNVILWTSQQKKSLDKMDSDSMKKIKIAVWNDSSLAEYLNEKGFHAQSTNDIHSDYSILIARNNKLNDEQYKVLIEKMKQNGVGFITGGLGWGWLQLNPGKTLVHDLVGNRNLVAAGAGFAWVDGFLKPEDNNLFSTKVPISPWIDGSILLSRLKNVFDGKSQDILTEAETQRISPDEKKKISSQITTTIQLAYGSLPELLRKQIGRPDRAALSQLVPQNKNPVHDNDLITRLLITMETERWRDGQLKGEVDPQSIEALAAGNDFPGAVPADAPRCKNQVVVVDPKVPDWHSTGLYAAPGQIITVRFPQSMDLALLNKYRIRIGAHSDELWHLNQWRRFPVITLNKPVNNLETNIVNPFGGPVYIVVPPNQKGESFEVQISGAVKAPFFVRDKTNLKEWKETIRNQPAPWAELQGNNIILTVPSIVVRELDNPQALMETWDKVLDIIAEFCSAPKDRIRPERMCPDRQISAGYMHSGYPFMTGLDVIKDMVDREKLLSKGNWGFFHELGHNHQSSYWTFAGTTEVTVNYFSLYVYDKLCNIPPSKTRYDVSLEGRRKAWEQYVKDGRRFEDWKARPFLALNMMVPIQEEFGWEPFIKAIAEYRTADKKDLPQNDDQKRDQWMVRLSKQIKRNLGPYFDLWRVPVSQKARDSIKELPQWMPKDNIYKI